MNKELDGLLKQYVLKSLDLQATKLKCINLGWSRDQEIASELEIIKACKQKIEKIW